MDDISAECDWLAGLVSSCLLWFSLGRGWDVEQLSGAGGMGKVWREWETPSGLEAAAAWFLEAE